MQGWSSEVALTCNATAMLSPAKSPHGYLPWRGRSKALSRKSKAKLISIWNSCEVTLKLQLLVVASRTFYKGYLLEILKKHLDKSMCEFQVVYVCHKWVLVGRPILPCCRGSSLTSQIHVAKKKSVILDVKLIAWNTYWSVIVERTHMCKRDGSANNM